MLKQLNRDRVMDMIVDGSHDEDFILIGKKSFSWGERDYYQVVLLDKDSQTFHYFRDNRCGRFEWQSEAYPISSIVFTPIKIEDDADGRVYFEPSYLAERWTEKPPKVTEYI